MDREHYIKDMPKHIEKIRAQVARISASEEICQQAIQLIREILEAANSTIRDSLDCDGTLAVNDIRISAKVNDRMKELVGQIEKKIENNATVKSLLFHLFFPEELPLQMSELQLLSDWLSSFQSDTDFKVGWGMVATSHFSHSLNNTSQEPLLRAIVLAVT